MSKISPRSVIACLLLTAAVGAVAAGQDKFQDRRPWIDAKTQTTDDPRRIPMPPGPRGPEGVIVLRGGRIFDGTGAPVREGTVVIRRNRIEKVLPPGAVDWPKEARVVDVSGKTVLPGLIDGHTHMDYAMPETPPGMGSNEADAMLRAVERTRYFLECGITSIRDVGSLRNVPFRLKEWVTENRVAAPRIFAAGAFITSTGGHGMEGSDPGDPDTGSFRVAEGADGWRQAVREQFTRGADFIKIGSHFSREEVKAAVEEAHSLGLKVGCDAETFYIQWAVEAGVDSIEHPLPRTDETIRLMAAKGTKAMPTLVPYIYIFDQWGGYFGSTSRRFTFSKEANLDVLRRMKRAGIKMGIGTDLVTDWYRYLPYPYITELKSFVEAGYTIPQALTAATKTNAEILDMSDKLGTLEPGKLADVTVIDGKPDLNLDDLARVDLVIRDGYVVVEGGRVVVPPHVPVVPPRPKGDDASKVTRLADEYVREYIARYPEIATFEGLPGAPDDKLGDNSLAALKAWQDREDAWLAELASVDGAALWGRPEWVTYGFLREALEGSKAARVARAELWPVNQMSGWQTGLALLASIQPVGTAVGREHALARWRQVPRYLDTEVANLKEGLRLGYSTPKKNVELTIAQLEALLAAPVRQSPLFSPAARDGSPEFVSAWEKLIAGEIMPAVRRYRDYLKQEYLPNARTTVAIADLPNGTEAYRAMIRASTTLDRTAEETYRLGGEAVARYEAEAAEIGRKLYGGLDLKAVVKKMADDPANHFKSREELLAFSKQAVDRARRAMPAWFEFIPKAEVVLEPVPAYLEQTASSAYESAASDGSRPGVYRINLYQPEAQSRATAELTAFHETYPGHHFQISVAKELPQAHMITRLVGSGSYVEGWARYSEALAEEMGLFSTEFARINRRLWPAHGMVVDPGLHVLGWSREKAIDYVLATGRFSPHEAEALIDRVIAWPAQLTTYDTGALEFFALRAKAEKALGPKFDIKAFHSEVLCYGAVTLPMLREIVDHWIALRAK